MDTQPALSEEPHDLANEEQVRNVAEIKQAGGVRHVVRRRGERDEPVVRAGAPPTTHTAGES